MYDMSMRPVPESWEDFQRYWKHMCAEVLEDNKATRDVLDLGGIAKPPFLPWLPDVLWRPVSALIARNFVWLTDRAVRPRDPRPARVALVRARRAAAPAGGPKLINAVFKLVPHDRRYHPRARAGWRRVRGEVAPDAALVETPRRNLPPLSERANPSTTRRTSRRHS
jgi:uncharacterized protein (DUF2236 family)